MPLDVSGVVTGQVIQAAHVYQYYNLLTGVMTDQGVTLKNQVTVGGSQGTGVVPLVVQGVSGQTSDLFDVKQFGGAIAFGISAAGAITFASGVTVGSGGITVSGASTFQTGGVTVQAGGLQVTAGNVGIGVAPSSASLVCGGASPFIQIGTTNAAGSGILRLPNGSPNGIGWRNAVNTADITFFMDASDRLGLTTSASTLVTTATAGTAGAPPAQVAAYLRWAINGTEYKMPVYLA